MKKGGGRESGGGAGTSTQAVPRLDPAASANPAALDLKPFLASVHATPKASAVAWHACVERIRVLEAELDAANGALNIQGGQIRALKAEREKLPIGQVAKWRARAERAEAREREGE